MLAYTYVGYPVLIGALARLFPVRAGAATDTDGGPQPTVSVCLPVLDGAKLLPAKVASLLAQDYPAERVEILIYCDGCSDDSESVARALAASPQAGGRIRVIAERARQGKPIAINVVGAAATGDLLLLNDVRQPLSPNAIRTLARAMEDSNVGCATGNLVLAGGAASGVYWRYENWIRRQESRFRGVVGMSGSIAMMRRADLMPLPRELLLDDVYMPMQLALRRRRVAFISEAHAYDSAFEDEQEFRRKVRTLSGNFQLFALMPALLSPAANPIWLETISHKVMRLVAPWLMLALAASSVVGATASGAVALPMRALVAAQLGFYAAAVVGRRAGRLAGVARTFVVLNAAAVVGLFRFLTGRFTW